MYNTKINSIQFTWDPRSQEVILTLDYVRKSKIIRKSSNMRSIQYNIIPLLDLRRSCFIGSKPQLRSWQINNDNLHNFVLKIKLDNARSNGLYYISFILLFKGISPYRIVDWIIIYSCGSSCTGRDLYSPSLFFSSSFLLLLIVLQL